MNLNQAIGNLSQVLLQGRITMPGGPLTAQEHQELAVNFNLLATRAKRADELEEQIEQSKPDLPSPSEPDEVPVEEEPTSVDRIEEDQDGSRTE